jgi:hypothetical protein
VVIWPRSPACIKLLTLSCGGTGVGDSGGQDFGVKKKYNTFFFFGQVGQLFFFFFFDSEFLFRAHTTKGKEAVTCATYCA